MALEAGLAILSSALSVGFEIMASPEFLNFFKRRKFNHELIKKLETKMIAFSSILDDAEEKQFASEQVRAWLLKLKEAAYDAEDVLDEIQIEYQAHQSKAVKEDQEKSSSSVLKMFSVSLRMLPRNSLTEDLESKLLGILERLEYLMQDSATLGLRKAVGEKRSSEKRETTSLVDEFEGFYGRDADKKAIIDMLILVDDNGSNPGVIPIVGMGGVGKTTLAKHVYNDKAVEEHFKIRAWVCVSDQFDETKITEEIVEKVTHRACHCNDLDQLQHKLKDSLDGKKFLIVLDDVWSEDYEKWSKLLTPLRYGAKGSKIVITTRSKRVASKVRTVPTHDLRKLEDEDCWKLFARHACLDVNSIANLELQEIGKEIVRKCGGIPLAAKALGGVLRCQTKAEKWMEVLKSEIWDFHNANILPALAMSYIHLPPNLKRCFAYCAIFPQDYKFRKEKLVALWLSEGFLVQQKGNQSLEEIGDVYFDDLVSRSFFQYSRYSWDGPRFVMHDLVHELARFVSGEFCSRLEGGTSWKIGEKTRHLSYEKTEEDDLMKFQGIYKIPFLRSFVLAQLSWVGCRHGNSNTCINKKVIDGLLPTRKLLRTLSLSCYGIRELPNSIGNLKHMRRLDLSETSIRFLPEAVTALFNLEILILWGCCELVELPADMARLFNLCQLDLRGTNLQRMPPEMGKLKKLSKLTDFVVGENGGSSIKELGHLHYLRGEISIRRLQNVKDDRDASKANLKDRENLKVLNLIWNGNADNSRQVKQVLERLQPHVRIESIKIWGYGGTEFPNWVGDISFSKLKQLDLKGCNYCICLPPLGQLASLEKLIISGGYGYDAVLDAIGLEFYGMCKLGEKPFSSLKTLEFFGMKNWREWSPCDGAFPVLEELELRNCPKLMSIPNHLPNLKRLRIEGCGEVDFDNLLISTWATLETIHIRGSEKMKCMSLDSFPNLKVLDISYCSCLESLGSAAAAATRTSDPLFSPSLTSLFIRESSKLVSFPRGGLHAPNLKEMDLCGCPNLKSLPQGMHSLLPSLEKLSISNCPELESFPEGGLPFKLQSLEIIWCKKLVGGRMQWGLGSLPCLSGISIRGGSCEDVESSFPEETLLPSSLKSLQIGGFEKMKSLNYKGLQHLSSLEALIIEGCNNVESLPEERLLSSLSRLQIDSCPLLERRCERETGEDWPKIKDIPRLYIQNPPTADELCARHSFGSKR